MTGEKEKRIFERFSFFKPAGSPMETLMCFGFECDDGWFDLIWKLCEDIEKLLEEAKNNSELDPEFGEFEVIQVKEKFGSLRFYTNWENGPIGDRIVEAENESAKTCEMCGRPGKLDSTSGWIKTVCDDCSNRDNHTALGE